MNVILGALVRRIKQRAYLDSDEEIARWIDEYCEQSNSHKPVVMQGLALKMQNCPPDILEIVERNWDKLIDASPTVASEGLEKSVCGGVGEHDFRLRGSYLICNKCGIRYTH